MKVSEVRYARRFNTGNYEHEEIALVAVLDEDDNVQEVLAGLKADVCAAHSGESTASPSDEAGTDEEEIEEEIKPAKKGKKSKPAPTTAPSEESEEDDDGATDEEIEEEIEAASEEEETEEEEEITPAKKAPSKDGAKDSKKFKKKPQVYQRSNVTHKDIFSKTMTKVRPNWKKAFESKAHAKKVSVKLEGTEFLDEKGKVLPSFEEAVAKAMGKMGK